MNNDIKETTLAIKTEALTKQYNGVTVVDKVGIRAVKGELYALLGVNGAGKTTTIRMLTGLTIPSSGDAFLHGHSVINEREKVVSITNVSPQETSVAPNLTVKENLVFVARIYGFNKSEAETRTNDIIERLGLQNEMNKKAKILSGGWQRRLSIAMSLVSEPEILFLDEPTLGLDVIARRELWDVIREIHGRITVVLTTHYLEEAEALADKIGIIAKGRLVAEGTASELKQLANEEKFEDAFVKLATQDKIN